MRPTTGDAPSLDLDVVEGVVFRSRKDHIQPSLLEIQLVAVPIHNFALLSQLVTSL